MLKITSNGGMALEAKSRKQVAFESELALGYQKTIVQILAHKDLLPLKLRLEAEEMNQTINEIINDYAGVSSYSPLPSRLFKECTSQVVDISFAYCETLKLRCSELLNQLTPYFSFEEEVDFFVKEIEEIAVVSEANRIYEKLNSRYTDEKEKKLKHEQAKRKAIIDILEILPINESQKIKAVDFIDSLQEIVWYTDFQIFHYLKLIYKTRFSDDDHTMESYINEKLDSFIKTQSPEERKDIEKSLFLEFGLLEKNESELKLIREKMIRPENKSFFWFAFGRSWPDEIKNGLLEAPISERSTLKCNELKISVPENKY